MILIPLYASVLISILLLPVTNLLERVRLPRSLAALLSVLLALLLVGSVIYLLSSQVMGFLNDIPAIKKHLTEHYETLLNWTQQHFRVSAAQQKSLINNATSGIEDKGMTYLKQTVFTVTETVAFTIFSFVYSFLILYYRQTIKRFLFAMFAGSRKRNIDEVLVESQKVIKNYMTGLLIEMVIISVTNTLLFMVIGIKYAVFLGVLTGILNIIPFIGIYSGIIFTALVTLTTSASTSQVVWIFAGLLIVHFIDANFLMPKVVGSKVKINALITILGAVVGGFLIGIAGVFFALPTIAICKIIFDRIEEMKPWGILLGDESSNAPEKRIVKKINKMIVKKPGRIAG